MKFSQFVILALLLIVPSGAEVTTYPDGDQRAVTLKGTRNTRDLGGLPLSGGLVKSGMVYRSGALCFASLEDAEKLQGLGIQTILELRLAS